MTNILYDIEFYMLYIHIKDYFEAVAQAILSAKSEIYIEDWWLVSFPMRFSF